MSLLLLVKLPLTLMMNTLLGLPASVSAPLLMLTALASIALKLLVLDAVIVMPSLSVPNVCVAVSALNSLLAALAALAASLTRVGFELTPPLGVTFELYDTP